MHSAPPPPLHLYAGIPYRAANCGQLLISVWRRHAPPAWLIALGQPKLTPKNPTAEICRHLRRRQKIGALQFSAVPVQLAGALIADLRGGLHVAVTLVTRRQNHYLLTLPGHSSRLIPQSQIMQNTLWHLFFFPAAAPRAA